MLYLLALSSFVASVLATAARTTAPTGAITVGSGGDYSTVGHIDFVFQYLSNS